MLRSLAIAALLAVGSSMLVGCSGAASQDESAVDDSNTSASGALSVKSMAVGASLVTTANLNLRSGPGTSHSVETVIPSGTRVSLRSTTSQNGWLSIAYGSKSGYSSGLYLKSAPASSGDDDDSSGDDDGSGSSTGSSDAVSRAEEWVSAQMPYCGGVEGGHDSICGGTCYRSGDANDSAWNSYRSDCSGLVSWAWGLSAPGLTTSGFAPFDTSVSHEIPAEELQPGDALNSDPEQHIILFKGWANAAEGKATVIEEYNCGHVATEHTITLEFTGSSSHVYMADWAPHNYRAIRKN